jgi:hypothetical protein
LHAREYSPDWPANDLRDRGPAPKKPGKNRIPVDKTSCPRRKTEYRNSAKTVDNQTVDKQAAAYARAVKRSISFSTL